MSKELTNITLGITRKVETLSITNEMEMIESVELLSLCNINLDKAKKEKESITKPAKEIIKRENERWAPIIDPLEEAITKIRSEQSRYQTELSRVAKEKEDKIISRVAPGKGKLTPETAIKKMEDIKRPDETISTSVGQVKFRDHQVLKITSLTDIPFEYFELNQTKLMQALKAGQNVPGAEIETIKIPINRR